ncbi:hypothetical protein Fmac_005446 [Flemingia macrophylla]|uniref:Uncharacterized protein n=1 Tax=Flemingia macrophylla TaxID=520843 RepID=A0ABD1N8C4_9FABA
MELKQSRKDMTKLSIKDPVPCDGHNRKQSRRLSSKESAKRSIEKVVADHEGNDDD